MSNASWRVANIRQQKMKPVFNPYMQNGHTEPPIGGGGKNRTAQTKKFSKSNSSTQSRAPKQNGYQRKGKKSFAKAQVNLKAHSSSCVSWVDPSQNFTGPTYDVSTSFVVSPRLQQYACVLCNVSISDIHCWFVSSQRQLIPCSGIVQLRASIQDCSGALSASAKILCPTSVSTNRILIRKYPS